VKKTDPSLFLFLLVALLSGARNAKNSYLSQQIFDRMKKNFPGIPNSLTSASILLANVYASSGDFKKAADIRFQLNKLGTKKKIGLSRSVVNQQVYVSLEVFSARNIKLFYMILLAISCS